MINPSGGRCRPPSVQILFNRRICLTPPRCPVTFTSNDTLLPRLVHLRAGTAANALYYGAQQQIIINRLIMPPDEFS
nr:MAG TPA_asm: hypothetical protein [Caudoviricetes sp.]